MASKECSYWFASILYRRFIRDEAKLLYSNERGMFGTLIDNMVLTSGGVFECDDTWSPWVDYPAGKEKENIIKKYIDML